MCEKVQKILSELEVDGGQLIYLASPYSNDDTGVMEGRFEEVCALGAVLLSCGVMVYCPIAHSHPMAKYGLPTEFDFWEKLDRKMISVCDRLWVVKMEGWEESRGIQMETKIAQELGKPVYYVDLDVFLKLDALQQEEVRW